jgi:hypothetical protein
LNRFLTLSEELGKDFTESLSLNRLNRISKDSFFGRKMQKNHSGRPGLLSAMGKT